MLLRGAIFGLLLSCVCVEVRGQARVVIGAKNFTESALLGELMAQMIEAHTDLRVERRLGLGGTMICWGALRAGEIDLYAEYTGTGWAIVLKEAGKIRDPLRTYFHVRRRYEQEYDAVWLGPFGLNNSYALSMVEAKAEELGIRRVSDLLPHQAKLRAGFSIEFGNREDGYPGLAKAYGLQLGSVRSLEHSLAYAAMASGAIDLMDAYSTDGKLLRYKLRVLEDDRGFFPPYHAAPVVRGETLRKHPEIGKALERLAFRLPNRTAQALNHLIESKSLDVAVVARAFLQSAGLITPKTTDTEVIRSTLGEVLAGNLEQGSVLRGQQLGMVARLRQGAGKTGRLLAEHLGLTLAAVLLAALVAIPLGILVVRRSRLRSVLLGVAGALQTVPSLALLALMIPLLGLSLKAAIAALFLYALLPILRNTYTGIAEVDPQLVDAARGMGMRRREILTRVQLPLATRTIMAGVRTATVISIGVATLAAFIGAGGLGEPIVEGLYLDDAGLILSGAVPAALLAILADWVLARVERRIGIAP